MIPGYTFTKDLSLEVWFHLRVTWEGHQAGSWMKIFIDDGEVVCFFSPRKQGVCVFFFMSDVMMKWWNMMKHIVLIESHPRFDRFPQKAVSFPKVFLVKCLNPSSCWWFLNWSFKKCVFGIIWTGGSSSFELFTNICGIVASMMGCPPAQ